MSETAGRLLKLLALLQSRRSWTGIELARRLEVTDRTIRADVDRLRALGYPVHSERGPAGHYRLGAGAAMPPLLLDDDEAVAVAVGLRTATGTTGIAESSERALVKLEQVLPARLRPKVDALSAALSAGPVNTDSDVADPEVDPDVLATVASAIKNTEWLRFDYHRPGRRGLDDRDPGARVEVDQAHADEQLPVTVEPYRMVSWQRRWYLVGRNTDDHQWNVHRIDWMDLRMRTGRRFTPEPMPDEEYVPFVLRTVAASGWSVHVVITVLAPAEEVLARINPAVGVVEVIDDQSCRLVTGADSYPTVAVYIGMLGLDFRVTEPPELVDHLRRLSQRYARAIGDQPPTSHRAH
jgi:predicted DNA-binding transcriptional regulator YafY